jgi:hypothetical protein
MIELKYLEKMGDEVADEMLIFIKKGLLGKYS